MERDVNKLLKEITLNARKGKKGTNYLLKVELKNGSSTEIFCEKEFVDAVKVLKDIYKEPIKRKVLIEETSKKREDDYQYVCILIELADGSEFRFFPKRAFNIIINALYQKLENENKVKSEK